MDRLLRLRERLHKIKPLHDTPTGLIHPYWARKPMNVIMDIIDCLSSPGAAVADPFMGSGTTIFAALALNRSAMGSDINPLSVFIVKTLLNLKGNSSTVINEADKFIHRYSDLVLQWYGAGSGNSFVERERFMVTGDFEDGRFSLEPIEIVTKDYISKKWCNRRTIRISDNHFSRNGIPRKYYKFPINFENINLLPNSRIAIPNGAALSHFYTKRNIAAINAALDHINNQKATAAVKDVQRLLLSSSLPLLRLSDKKASSQWPYWRPKKMLTSRNPVIILQKRLSALREGADWINDNLAEFKFADHFDFGAAEQDRPSACIKQLPIQKIINSLPIKESFDLVLTDPPYTDHVPYLEYSSLWVNILDLPLPKYAYRYEIVNSDSPNRRDDTREYLARLVSGFDVCCKMVKKGGYLVWFYQDLSLRSWTILNDTALRNNIEISDVIPLQKQRRSMKTVTTPGGTLDGDLICIFRKGKTRYERVVMTSYENMREKLSKELKQMRHEPFFEKYAFVIRFCLKNNCIDQLSQQFSNVKSVIHVFSK